MALQHDQVVLRIVTKLLAPLIMVFGLYVQFHGDFGPGGGFQAGVIFASAVILYGLVFGLDAARAVIPPRTLRLLAPLGVLLYAGTGVLTLLLGENFLSYNAIDPAHPAKGQHYGILAVELGVGITVASVMMLLFFAFAGRGKVKA
ncbi:Na(+)/H(+) antiporter subunit B [bacterium]|nr:Na(+)/H(+) antiporter subunit B [bacterium]